MKPDYQKNTHYKMFAGCNVQMWGFNEEISEHHR